MARLYANENFPMPVVAELRRLGHDVLSSLDAGHSNQALPDDEVLRFAIQENRAILTLNRKHFIRLHHVDQNHEGIIVCTVDADFEAQAARIEMAINEREGLACQLIRVNRPPSNQSQPRNS